MKEITFTQSILVKTVITVMVPSDWNDNEVRAMCEDFPVKVTVDSNHNDGEDEVSVVGLVVDNAIWQSNYAQLDNNTTI